MIEKKLIKGDLGNYIQILDIEKQEISFQCAICLNIEFKIKYFIDEYETIVYCNCGNSFSVHSG